MTIYRMKMNQWYDNLLFLQQTMFNSANELFFTDILSLSQLLKPFHCFSLFYYKNVAILKLSVVTPGTENATSNK